MSPTNPKSNYEPGNWAVANQERELAEKLLWMADEAGKRVEKARVQLRMELAAEKAKFKKEMAEFKKGMVEFKRRWPRNELN